MFPADREAALYGQLLTRFPVLPRTAINPPGAKQTLRARSSPQLEVVTDCQVESAQFLLFYPPEPGGTGAGKFALRATPFEYVPNSDFDQSALTALRLKTSYRAKFLGRYPGMPVEGDYQVIGYVLDHGKDRPPEILLTTTELPEDKGISIERWVLRQLLSTDKLRRSLKRRQILAIEFGNGLRLTDKLPKVPGYVKGVSRRYEQHLRPIPLLGPYRPLQNLTPLTTSCALNAVFTKRINVWPEDGPFHEPLGFPEPIFHITTLNQFFHTALAVTGHERVGLYIFFDSEGEGAESDILLHKVHDFFKPFLKGLLSEQSRTLQWSQLTLEAPKVHRLDYPIPAELTEYSPIRIAHDGTSVPD